MLAMVLACILIGVLTYYQIFKQGLFSAMIMAVLSLVAALIALNYFEQLGNVLTGWGLARFSPQAISLLTIFAISLLAMRLITDRLISGNMNFALIIDRVGAGFFGFISSIVVAGILTLGFQLLPGSPELLMYDRYENDHAKYVKESGLFPYADAFVTSLMAKAGNNAFAGPKSFQQTHPEFLRELYLNRITLDPGSRQEAGKNAIELNIAKIIGQRIGKIEYKFSGTGKKKKLVAKPAGQHIATAKNTLLLVNIRIQKGRGTKDDPGTQDVDGKCRYMMGSFRLVGFTDEQRNAGIARYPIGVLHISGVKKALELKSLNKGALFSDRSSDVALIFEWPHKKGDPKVLDPKPLFLEFKRSARADIVMAKPKRSP